VTASSLNGRVRKLQSSDHGRSLEWWAAQIARYAVEAPDHILVSICVGRLIALTVANNVFDHLLCVAWREDPDSRHISFPDWLEARGASIGAVLDDVRQARAGGSPR
jgi:hypothetical protein